MPDGTGKRLSEYLKDNSLERQTRRSSGKESGRKWDAHVIHDGKADPDVQQLLAVGRGKRRRWLGDLVLRKMAGSMTADAMEALFQPAPFGESRVSLLEQISSPENAAIWDMFRSIDPDKQTKVLQRWEAHIRAEREGEDAGPGPAQQAWQRWATVSRKARTVLKRASPELVAVIELSFLHFLEEEDETQLEVALQEGFLRLIAHGLAAFHGLTSVSRDAEGASGRSVLVSKPRSGAPTVAPQITCADILFALEDMPAGGLTPALLGEFAATHDRSSSEASFVIV